MFSFHLLGMPTSTTGHTLATSTDSVTEFPITIKQHLKKPIQASLDLFFLISSGLSPTGDSRPGQVVIHCFHFHPSEQSYCDNNNEVNGNGHHDENDNEDDAEEVDEDDDDYDSYKKKRLLLCLILKPSLKSQHDTSLHDTAAKYL